MMISIGDKHFIESSHIVEILKASDIRAAGITHTVAESRRLINATGGKKIRSIIKLKSKHIVLSALGAETLKTRSGNIVLFSASGNRDPFSRKRKNDHSNESKPPETEDRRIEADRRRFSYTHHIPERRSGVKRRIKDRR